MSTDGAENARAHARTILDYLNEDCWRAVLDYVPLADILRTEPASKRWQETVLTYLRGKIATGRIRIGIKKRSSYFFLGYGIMPWLNVEVETLNLPSFELWCSKLGNSVVSVYCDSKQTLKIVGKCCHKVKALQFESLPEHLISTFETFKELESIYIYNCNTVSDDCLSRFLANTNLKFLDIWTNARITGQCFSKRTKNLKRLALSDCKKLDIHHLIAADLRGLTELELHFVPVEVTRNILSLLRNMPNLVLLDLMKCTDDWDQLVCRRFFETVIELRCLEYLCASFEVTDEELVLVARSCGRLRELILDNCIGVSGRGVAEACACAGSRLVRFGFAWADVTDADVEAVVRACPKLERLDVRWCERLTPALLANAAAARRDVRARRPLRIDIANTRLCGIKV